MTRLQPRETLPSITEPPKAAFLAGFWAGIAIGAVNGIAAAIVLLR